MMLSHRMPRILLLSLVFNSHWAFSKTKTPIDPKLTEQWTPIPNSVMPKPIPSDAIILFDGRSKQAWQHQDGSEAKWINSENTLTVKPGSGAILTKEVFCDIQLHIEWRSPKLEEGVSGQHLGNSGIFLQSRYELQILDSYKNDTYSNGQAGSIYKQSPPLVNASLPPLTWQSYDIIYKAPRFNAQGKLLEKAYITALHNGVLIQNHTEIQGPTRYIGTASYTHAHSCAPLLLQDHSDLVSYRNIWLRKL